MAGDWIKLQKDTFDKPEVLAIATRMGIDPDAVVGKLCRIWAWFDTHTVNGNASCVTFSFVDRYVGVTGFAEQVALVGWLEQNGNDLTLPNFNYHTGESAKTRALGKNRTEKSRSNANSNGKSNALSVTKSLQEKRREEKNINTGKAVAPPDGVAVKVWQDFLKTRKTKVTETAIEGIRREAGKAGITLETALETICERGWQSFKAEWVSGKPALAASGGVLAGAI